ncbi:MAG: rhodanese-like domain-containing protein [Bryobacteraceae bacterium]|nr:MAG: rhodanese-like domain-containing protein [Bryobacteraceae bacterium]
MMTNESVLAMEITPDQAAQLLAEGKATLIDVREPHEYLLARIEGAELIPMHMVPERLQDLEAAADEKLLIVYCHHGIRSLSVVEWLRRQGVEQCVSLIGGIDLWSRQIDPTVPRY